MAVMQKRKVAAPGQERSISNRETTNGSLRDKDAVERGKKR